MLVNSRTLSADAASSDAARPVAAMGPAIVNGRDFPPAGLTGSVEDEAAAVIARNSAGFDDIMTDALAYQAAGQPLAAAAFAAMAAQFASHRHPGFFASPRLERLLIEIGLGLPGSSSYRRPDGAQNPMKRVLHVCSQVVQVGGHTKMLCRWLKADAGRKHSVVLTQQRGPVPQTVIQSIHEAGGELTRLNQRPGTLLTWASRLREIAQGFDVVILHIGNQDVVPVLAFADPRLRPPVAFLNHSDHMFWIGAGVSDIVINLRDAASDISLHRRGVPVERNLLVPTLVDATIRRQSRAQAKASLGFDESDILILSAARAVKYRTLGGKTFAGVHVPLLRMHTNAKLLVLGAGHPQDWKPAIAETNGRIVPLAETPDPRPYFEAADIYVDSYPFVSSTSMMEAAGYGLPLVTRFEGPDEARITAINHPGIVGPAIHAANEGEYVRAVSKLITDEQHRASAGELAKAEVARLHEPAGWLASLNAALAVARDLPALEGLDYCRSCPPETPYAGEPDRRLNEIFGEIYSYDRMLLSFTGFLPVRERWRTWNRLRRAQAFHSRRQMAGLILPEWMVRALESHVRLY